MKKPIVFILAFFFFAASLIPASAGMMSLSVSPSSARANYAGGFTFQTGAATIGGDVRFQIYHDRNRNGTIDAGELPIVDETVIDNGTDASYVLNWDTDTAYYSITIILNPFESVGGYLPAGRFIAKVENSEGTTASLPFTINSAYAARTLTGTVLREGTGIPVEDAVVTCISASGGCASLTDGNGDYTLQIPAAGDYEVRVTKKGYTETITNTTIPSGGATGFNIDLPPALSGNVTEYGTGSPVEGAEVWARASDGSYSQTFTDIDGNYSLPVAGGKEWFLGAKGVTGLFGPQIPSNNYESNIFITPLTSIEDTGNGRYALDFSELPPNTGTAAEVGYVGLGQSIPSMAGIEFTIEAMVKRKTGKNINGGIFSRAGDEQGLLLYVNNNVPQFALLFNEAGSPVIADSGVAIAEGEWAHLAVSLVNEDHGSGPDAHADCSVNGDPGTGIDMAKDSSGNIHAAYRTTYGSAHFLNYITNASGAWVKKTIDYSGTIGKAISIAIDPLDKVHISYYDTDANDPDGNPEPSLRYATNSSGAWVNETLKESSAASIEDVGKYNSIALDPSGYVHILYFQIASSGNNRYAYITNNPNTIWSSGTWRITIPKQASADSLGKYASLIIDTSGISHLTFYDETNGDLMYQSGNAVTQKPFADWASPVAVSSTGDVGRGLSMALDPAGDPHIAFTDLTGQSLKHASLSGGTWSDEYVESWAYAPSSDLLWTAIGIDSSGSIHIGYYDSDSLDLRYATDTSGSWVSEAVESAGDSGRHASLTALSPSSIAMLYYDLTDQELHYASGSSGAFASYIIDDGKASEERPHIDLFVDGQFSDCTTTGSSFTGALDLRAGGSQMMEQIGSSQVISLQKWADIKRPNNIGPEAISNAVIDEVRFWTAARSLSEINECRNRELKYSDDVCSIDNSILKGYWSFNEGSGIDIRDRSGTDNNGRKTYCDYNCYDFTATSLDWEGGWSSGYTSQSGIGTSVPDELNITLHSQGALINATVHDEHGSPVEGAHIYARRVNTTGPELKSLGNSVFTDASGLGSIGLEAGDWNVGACTGCHDHPEYVGGEAKELVPPAEVGITLTASQTAPLAINIYYADGAVEGTVFQQDGITPVPAGYIVEAATDDALNGPGQSSVGPLKTMTETIAGGNYRLPLLGGDWSISSHWMGKYRSAEQPVTITTDGDELIEAGETSTRVNLSLITSLSNSPPSADTGGPYATVEGSPLALDGSASSDTDGIIVLYEWDIDNNGTYDYSSATAAQAHTYLQNGFNSIRLRVTDDIGATDNAATSATISDSTPSAGFTGNPLSGVSPLNSSFTNSSTGYDQPLTYEWDFENSGSTGSTLLNPSYEYTGTGTYSVKLTVTDADGSSTSLLRTNYINTTSCLSAARIDGTSPAYFNFAQSAYDSAFNSNTLQFRDVSFAEDLTFDLNTTILIQGGFNCDYTTGTGTTTINGNVTISNGVVTMENIKIQ